MPVTYKLISSVTVGSGGAANIEFTSIPGTFDDLLFVFSCRENFSGVGSYVVGSFNSTTTNYSARELIGAGSGAPGSNTYTTGAASRLMGYTTADNATASTFGNSSLYIPNYRSSANKSWSVDGVSENNATTAVQVFIAGLWTNSAAITSASFTAFNGQNWMQHSTAYLYGIKNS